MISVLVVDDNAVIRRGIAALLEGSADMRVAGEAANGREAIELARELKPDVVLLDLRMPVQDGISAARVLSRGSKVMMLTYAEDEEQVTAAMAAGASGFLVHGRFEPDELARRIRDIAAGELSLSPAVAPAVLGALREEGSPRREGEGAEPLTERERELMALLARGLSNQEIADELVISPKTVKNHLNHIYSKLGVRDRGGAIAAWLGTGAAGPGPTQGPERGQTSVEYLGVIVVVAVVIFALVSFARPIAAAIAGGISNAVCQIIGSGCEGAGPEGANPLSPTGALPPGQVLAPGPGSVGVDPTGTQADPVNSLTGAFETQVTDARLPGPGIPFALTRSYSSENSDEGPLGAGWTHPYAARLEIGPNQLYTLHAGDGQRVRFTRRGQSFTSDPGVRSELAVAGTGYELTTRDQIRWRFDAEGKLVSIADRNDNTQTLTHDPESDLLTGLTDTAGREVSFENDDEGRLVKMTLPDGRETRYSYDDSGNLSKVTDLRGGETEFGYEDGLLDSITDQLGERLIENTYSEDARVVSQTDARGHVTEFDWDETARTQVMTDARGESWTDTYDEAGRLVSQRDPLGNTTTYEWDDQLHLTAVTDPRNFTWRMSYDDADNVTQVTAPQPLGYTETYAYNELNDPTTYTDPAGFTWSATYDERGNLASVALPDGARTSVERDGRGLPTRVSDPLGRVTAIGYDPQGNAVRITDPLGQRNSFSFDQVGRLVAATDPRAPAPDAEEWTGTFAYNEADQMVEISDPLGNTAQAAFDPSGRLESVTDPKGRISEWAYDPMGNLLSVTAPGDTTTAYAYDEANALVVVSDPRGDSTRYLRDDAGRVTSVIGPSGEQALLAYDRSGNLTDLVDPNGLSTGDPDDGHTRIDRDALGRPTEIAYSDDDTPDLGIEWDSRSGLRELRDGDGTERYVYDSAGRLTSVTRGDEAFRYDHDLAGQLIERSYPDGSVQRYDYDAAGRLASAGGPAGEVTYGYDAASNITRAAFSNGVVETAEYDTTSRITATAAKSGSELVARSAYTFDEASNPTLVETESGPVAYSYDERDRLVEACYAASCEEEGAERETFAYDSIGNLTERTGPEGTTSFAYDDSSRLTSLDGPEGELDYAHDANGNVTLAGDRSYEYDQLSRVTRATLPEGETTYTYEALLRASATSPSGSSTFSWDKSFGLPQLASESGPQGARAYTYGNGRIAQSSKQGTLFFHADALGSSRGLTTPKGTTAARATYRSYGGERSEDGEFPTAFRFTGERRDETTELYYLRARDYDPASGRFLQADPLHAGVGEPWRSRFSYAESRPSAYTDPSGMILPALGIGGAALVKTIAGSAVIGGTASAGIQAATTDEDSAGEIGSNFIEGAIPGAVLPVAGPAGGTVRGLLGASATSTSGRVIAGGTAGSIDFTAGAAGVTADSLLSGEGLPGAGEVALGGGLNSAGGFAGNALFPFQGVTTLRQAPLFLPRTPSGLIDLSQPNTQALFGQNILGNTIQASPDIAGALAQNGIPQLQPVGSLAPGAPGGIPPLVPIGQLPTK